MDAPYHLEWGQVLQWQFVPLGRNSNVVLDAAASTFERAIQFEKRLLCRLGKACRRPVYHRRVG